ncbi:MAG: type II toxin-antitoxin system RelE family toxin [Dehalococcoidia bacterium]
MRSRTTAQFRRELLRLPENVQRQARAAYQHFKQDPFHPSLHFKRVNAAEPVYSVRVGLTHRAVALVEHGEAVWFWIGSHADYDHLISRL